MRFVAPDAQLSVMEIKWGLVPDMAGLLLMRGLVRDDVARELIFSGRIFSGQEAYDLGLATRVCDDPRGEALAFAREVAAKNPDAIRAGKRLLALAVEAHQHAILLAETTETGEADWITQSGRGGAGELGEARPPVRRLTEVLDTSLRLTDHALEVKRGRNGPRRLAAEPRPRQIRGGIPRERDRPRRSA